MSITTHRETPCWEVYRADTGEHPNQEAWPHHASRAEAEQEQAEWEDYDVLVRQSFDKPCARIICDGCGDELDASGDEGWTHFDPSEAHLGPGIDWPDIEWVARGGKHYHDDCAPPWCEDCETEGHDVDDCPGAVTG